MADSRKRKASNDASAATSKKNKFDGPKKWRVVRKNQNGAEKATIEVGDSGIWVTCSKGREGKCTAELRDLFNEYASKLYGVSAELQASAPASGEIEADADIEADISKEIESIKQLKRQPLFQPVRVDVPCVIFFKTRAPVVSTGLVQRICSDARDQIMGRRTRFTMRLTPMTMMAKATEKGLDEVCKAVLAPHFHQPDRVAKKFAIRPTIRNHGQLSRDAVIKQVAESVGSPHTVDLKNYDLLILVDICKNVCGMAVIGNDFEKLKKYNLTEIHDPTPAPIPSE